MNIPKGVLVISNYDVGDDTFDSDVGSWNVTRAVNDCAAGKHRRHDFNVAETLAHNDQIDVEEDKINSMIANQDRFEKSPPPIFIEQDGKIWLIDGHHRLRALARLGHQWFTAYVIEEKDAKPYQMWFNGNRISPWLEGK